jgi:hypothetical protein
MSVARPALPLRLLALPVVLALCAAAGRPASAEGIVRISWDHPADSPGQLVGAKSYGGPGSYDVWVTLSGQSTPVRCFEIELYVQSARPGCQPAPAPPAAWRFDGAGCAARHACFDWNSLAGTDPAQVAGREFISDTGFDPNTGLERIIIAECDGLPLATPDPARTYTLARFHFDHTGTCAGEADSALITLATALWVPVAEDGSNGPESDWPSDAPLGLGWNVSSSAPPPCNPSALQSSLANAQDPPLYHDPNMSLCDVAVPARGMTWGQIKAAYR